MLKCEILDVQGLKPAIHGMRNPKNSWNKSDSDFEFLSPEGVPAIGNNDMKLMNTLFRSGTEHRKFDRMITVWMDIEAPLYWWKEFDTYKIGTVANSCSTMHKIHSKKFTLDDFSHEHLNDKSLDMLLDTIKVLNEMRDAFNTWHDNYIYSKKDYWWNMIQLLPSSYNQKRTVMVNYEVVARIIQQRSGHKLDEWHQLIDVLKTLSYVDEIMK